MIPALPKLNCKYGAPMGRPSHAHPANAYKVYVSEVRIDSQGYDRGGAYWGIGGPLFWVTDATGEFSYFLRACSRKDAIMTLREDFPELTFYRGE